MLYNTLEVNLLAKMVLKDVLNEIHVALSNVECVPETSQIQYGFSSECSNNRHHTESNHTLH